MLHDLEALSADVSEQDVEFVNLVDGYLYKTQKEVTTEGNIEHQHRNASGR